MGFKSNLFYFIKKIFKNYRKRQCKYDKILKDNFTREEVIINMVNSKGKNAVNTKSNKHKKKKKNKNSKRSKMKLIIILLILIIGVICTYLLMSPNFKIKEISITGNQKLSKAQIMSIAEVKMGDSIFSTLDIVLKVKLKQHGYIEDAVIKKIYPNKLEIQVKERQKQFQIKTETEGYINIDEQGYIIDFSVDKLEIPTIFGMDITEKDVGSINRLTDKDLNKMENILQIREECRKIEIVDKIIQIQVKDEYIISLNDGISINLGDATNLKNRMYYVNAILKQESGNKGTIYVNGNLNEGFLSYFSAN